MKQQIENYFKEIDKKVVDAYKTANKARKKGYDPEDEVNITLAKNMAERVEGLVGALIPDIINSGLSRQIQSLEKKYGKSDLRVALSISLEVVKEKFCKFENKVRAMEAGIRVGLAYLTMGVVSSPLEGFVELKLKKRADGKEYFCLMYSGPIRSAGGTAGALSIVIADNIRKNMGYDVFDATEKEIRRTVTELYDYHERITNLQYLPSEKEIRFLVKNLPVQIDGDSSEKIEVSNYKDLGRIETNNIRSGPCLVLGECIAQKASKVWNLISRGTKDFGLENWSFLEEFLSLQKKAKAKDTDTGKLLPVYTFIQDLVAGRPVLTYPLAAGGFRLRYGRSRNSGYSATSIHPATMIISNKYLATGTQLRVERPGKAAAITVCDSIEGPIVKLKDDSVIRLENESLAKQHESEIKEILFLGDILVSYGDFYNRAHTLLPPGYCEEWWSLEAERASVDIFGTFDLEKLAQLLETEKSSLEILFKDPINTQINAATAFKISKKLKIPLHPKFTYHWDLVTAEDFSHLLKLIVNSKLISNNSIVTKLVITYEDSLKSIFDNIGLPHLVVNKEFIVIENDDAHTISEIFHLNSNDRIKFEDKINDNSSEEGLYLINTISDVKIRDKSGVFIGARMGRPEKAKMRKLTGSPHTLFPVGGEGGRLRSFQSSFESNKISAEFPLYRCDKCNKNTIFSICETCDKKTTQKYHCRICGTSENNECSHGPMSAYSEQTIAIKDYFDGYLKKLKIKTYPDLIKGVRGTSNKEHIPEHFVKGIFRAKYDICVNKDGTTRYDMTQLPITHFKPKEIKTTVQRLRELGYTKDISGKELKQENQILEIMPQDIILPSCDESPELGADKILLKTSFFIDDILSEFYKLNKFYNMKSEKDITGALVSVLAPHTSAAVVGRIIGFSGTQGFLAHPMFHAATRRDCDGDEASVTLLMDTLLNFSKQFLPGTRGSTQDAPLVLSSKLIPSEVDDMAFDLDIGWKYPLEFYEACMDFKQPWEVEIERFGSRLDKENQYSGLGFTHNVSSINGGVRCSAYKTIPSMEKKIKGQMDLADKIRAVDASDVAKLVIEKHLIKDIKGNLRKFSMQQFRCSNCNEKYRRPPLIGKCIKCDGKIIFTISEGFIIKYLEPAISLADKYDLPLYLKQTLELTKRNVESMFGREKEKQEGLGRWFG
ncbi:DNA polymerase II large subunit [archaeon]|jgi:DNA polymerase II large subunit|nr:DNA polymerase II large subunit [archaeon]MDP6548129.1 DNA polymerase II large subunit [Candidatus Woesearchaeota archaeon]|tara:strand:+ start:3943 stop:7461 length:3519 start_codon:yes stop_codon:yes gene_type:complete